MTISEHLRPTELTLDLKKGILMDYFRQNARVLDKEKGYITAPCVNLEIDPLL